MEEKIIIYVNITYYHNIEVAYPTKCVGEIFLIITILYRVIHHKYARSLFFFNSAVIQNLIYSKFTN